MLGTDFTKNKKAQSGSVMLEVIAVLALMGVMGAMLFRQIYQRNQELHNIQMASEIRTVKEAFSAYIQAYRTELFSACNSGPLCSKDSAEIGKAISQFLPAGWFADSKVENYYTFTMWSYIQDEVTNKRIIYGLIAPKETTLPSTGWNFKRAARVALLIGADGGVYGDGITSGQIAGALGTWHLDEHSDMGLEPTTYVAMTGLDVFTPEYNLPEGNVNLRENWHLATEELGAWNYFSVGGGKTSCFEVGHHEQSTDAGLMRVKNDGITRPGTTCQPLFYVDNAKSKVFVNNDLEIGQGENANVTITQEGVIKQAVGLTIDANGRIISQDKLATAIGDLKNDDPYVIDPKYTSVMGDIRLVSRGGVRLSDILPNYILKEVKTITGGTDITIPTCPIGYKKAIVVTPVSWDQGEVTFKKGSSAITATSFPVAATTANLTELKGTVSSAPGDVTFKKGSSAITATSFPVAATTANLTELKGTVTEGICVKITKSTATTDGLKAEESTITGKWEVVLGHKNDDNSCAKATDIRAIAQTYCVYDNTGVSADMTQAECTAAGFTWNSDTTNGKIPHCSYVYQSCSAINSSAAISNTNKPAVCKAAGCQWNGNACA